MKQIPKSSKFTFMIILVALFAVACSGGTVGDAVPASDGNQDSRVEAEVQQDEAEPEDPEESEPAAEAEEESGSESEGAVAPEPSGPIGKLNLKWDLTQIGEGIKPAFVLDSADKVHVAYLTEEDMGAVFYATNSSGDFAVDTVAQGYFYGPVDIGIGPDDIPIIAYHDHQALSFDPNLGDEVVAIPSSDGWQLVTVEDAGHDGWDNSIVVDSSGNWHTAAIDPAQFGSESGVEYATNAGGSVSVTAVGSGPINYEFGTSIRLDNDGLPGIVYYDQAEQGLEYAKFDGSQWTVELVDNNGDAGRYASLVYDSANNPHISSFAFDGDTTGEVRHAWLDGGSWQFEVVDRLEDVRRGRVGARKITALAIDDEDNLHIAYSDRNRVIYGQRGDDGWSTQEIPKNSDNFLGQLVELELDSEGRPHLIWFEVTEFSPMLTGDIIYASPA